MSHIDKIRTDNQKMQQDERSEFILHYALSFYENLSQHPQFYALKKQLSDFENHDMEVLSQTSKQGLTKVPKTIWYQLKIITGLSKLAGETTEQFTDYEFAATLLLFSHGIVKCYQEGEHIRQVVQQIMHYRNMSLSNIVVDIQQIKNATQVILDYFELFLTLCTTSQKQNSTYFSSDRISIQSTTPRTSNSISSYMAISKDNDKPQQSKVHEPRAPRDSNQHKLCPTCASNNKICMSASCSCSNNPLVLTKKARKTNENSKNTGTLDTHRKHLLSDTTHNQRSNKHNSRTSDNQNMTTHHNSNTSQHLPTYDDKTGELCTKHGTINIRRETLEDALLSFLFPGGSPIREWQNLNTLLEEMEQTDKNKDHNQQVKSIYSAAKRVDKKAGYRLILRGTKNGAPRGGIGISNG